MVKSATTKVSKKDVVPVAPKGKKAKKQKPVKEPEPESEEESSEEEAPEPVPVKTVKRKANGKAAPAPTKKSKKQPEPEESEEDEESDAEEMEVAKNDEESSEEESDEEEAPAAKKANGKAKVAAKEESDDEEDEESEDEESEEEKPAKKGKAKKADKKEESEEESEDEESEDELVKKSGASAAGKGIPAAPADEGETVDLFIGNLPFDDEDREENIRKFFSSHGVEISEVRTRLEKPFGHVSLANSADKEKALALSGEEMNGNQLRIDNTGQRKSFGGDNNRGGRGGGRGGGFSGSAAQGNRVAMFNCSESQGDIQAATNASDVFCLSNKNLAFLTFDSNSEAAELVKSGSVEINGQSYNVEMARPRGEGGRGGGRGRGGRGGGGGRGFGGRGGGGRGGRGGRGRY